MTSAGSDSRAPERGYVQQPGCKPSKDQHGDRWIHPLGSTFVARVALALKCPQFADSNKGGYLGGFMCSEIKNTDIILTDCHPVPVEDTAADHTPEETIVSPSLFQQHQFCPLFELINHS